MKIITWNCNGAFRKKFTYLAHFDADIYVIQECENPAESNDNNYKNWANNYLWIGDSKNKGLAIFAKDNIQIKRLDWTNVYKNHNVKHFLPCLINDQFNLLAVWTHQNNSPTFGYIGQFWKYLQLHKSKLSNSIIVGDFNSNKIWDKWDRWWNHSDVVMELKNQDIESLYHKFTEEEQGKESTPTFYLQRNLNKPYHIDYCFTSKNISDKLINIKIEPFEKWKSESDHCPIIMEFKL